MDDEAIRDNRRRRLRQRYRRRFETINEVVNDAEVDHEDDESLSLSLGPTSYSSQIPLVTPPPRRAPPPAFLGPMTTWPTQADLRTRSMPYSCSPYSMTRPYQSSSWLNNSLHQPGSRGLFSTPNQPPPANNFFLTPPSNQTTPALRPVMMRPINAGVGSSRSRSARNQRSNMIPPPFPWATNIRGKIHSLEYLKSQQIATITGEVECRDCKKTYKVSYKLRESFAKVEMNFTMNKGTMRERAPTTWTNPEHRRCELCGHEKAVKPVIATRKSQINWLFLLLGQTLGHCTLGQLKNFCKHSNSHRTGAKDRVLYLTYLGLCKMLDPNNKLFDL